MRNVFILLFWLLPLGVVWAQKVAVVLSGGGAKGLAHIGALKALEENEIPIDYIIGTSMGGVVGGLYAAGMSPDQIERLFLLDEFQNWIAGKADDYYNLYYKKKQDNASWFSVNLAIDSKLTTSLKSNLANDQAINFALEETLAPLAVAANYNFDSLFVPFRTVAADIFTQSLVVLDSGRLSEAIRATFTVPFFYRPIKVNNKLLFDGGIYNNFPVDIAQEEWNPDFIIGVNVANTKYQQYPIDEDEELIAENLALIILDKTDPGKIGDNGIYIEPDLEPYTAFSFDEVRALIDSGYAETSRNIEEIKNRVERRQECEGLFERRNAYVKKSPPLYIDEVQVEGFNKRQKRFIENTFRGKRKGPNQAGIKRGYFELTYEKFFTKVYPKFIYDTVDNRFDFKIVGKPRAQLDLEFGGNISTRSISELYMGFEFRTLSSWLNVLDVNFYTGRFYQSVGVENRFVFPTRSKFYVKPLFVYNEWDYFEADDILASGREPTIVKQFDRKVGGTIGLPWRRNGKLEITVAYFNNDDNFSPSEAFVTNDTLDEIDFSGIRYGFLYSRSSLNRKQYPSAGSSLSLAFDYINGVEDYTPGSLSALESSTNDRTWFRLKFNLEQYFSRRKYKFGYVLESVLSTQPLFSSFQGTLLNAPSFYPLQDSRTLILENFRSFNYLAAGAKSIWEFRKNFEFRLEGYLFKPFERIVPDNNQEQLPSTETELTNFQFAGAATTVYHSPVGPIALSLNYYDDDQNQFGVLLHVGYLLFNKRSLD